MARKQRMQLLIVFKQEEQKLYEHAKTKENFAQWAKSILADELFNESIIAEAEQLVSVNKVNENKKEDTLVWKIPTN